MSARGHGHIGQAIAKLEEETRNPSGFDIVSLPTCGGSHVQKFIYRTGKTPRGPFSEGADASPYTQTSVYKHLRMPALTAQMCLAQSHQMAHIEVKPRDGMMYDKVKIKVTGLQPQQTVTLAMLLEEADSSFVSHGHYTSDSKGTVCLQSMASSEGTYTGCEPMGLFWSLTPAKGSKKGLRLRQQDVTQPHYLTLSVLADHVEATVKDYHHSEGVLAQEKIKRFYMAPHVTRIPVREGRVRGTVFLPNNGQGHFPGVIDLYGSTGGLAEYRASLLASQGFTTFALAYMMYEDLPKDMVFDFDYFEEAVEWFCHHPNVAGDNQLGIVGISKGAELALYMSTIFKQVRAVAALGNMSSLSIGEHYYKGKLLESADVDFSLYETTPEGLDFSKVFVLEGAEHCMHKVEEADQAEFLFIHGLDDMNCDVSHSMKMANRLLQHGRQNFSLHLYAGTGHLIEPPYMPHSGASFHKVLRENVLTGGQCKLHSHAQTDAWEKILEFLRRTLPPVTVTSSRL